MGLPLPPHLLNLLDIAMQIAPSYYMCMCVIALLFSVVNTKYGFAFFLFQKQTVSETYYFFFFLL